MHLLTEVCLFIYFSFDLFICSFIHSSFVELGCGRYRRIYFSVWNVSYYFILCIYHSHFFHSIPKVWKYLRKSFTTQENSNLSLVLKIFDYKYVLCSLFSFFHSFYFYFEQYRGVDVNFLRDLPNDENLSPVHIAAENNLCKMKATLYLMILVLIPSYNWNIFFFLVELLKWLAARGANVNRSYLFLFIYLSINLQSKYDII